ncbi:MAG: ABC transporter, ATP-binding protein, partial [uncultured Solirubrobacteraceae bacterium]
DLDRLRNRPPPPLRRGPRRRRRARRRVRLVRPRLVRRRHGPVGLGQVDADAPARRPRLPDLGLGDGRGDGALRPRRRGADPPAPRQARLRLPGVQPRPGAQRGGEHPPPTVDRGPQGGWGRFNVARHAHRRRRPRRPPHAPPERALRRPAAARRGRPGAHQPPGRRVRRRAHRQPRLEVERRRPRAPAPRRRRVRPDRRHGHARPGRRGRGRPGRRDGRRPARRRPPDPRSGM